MTRWRTTVQLADVFHDEDLPFEQRRDLIGNRLLKLVATGTGLFWDTDAGMQLEELLDELGDTRDNDEFNAVWDEIYDWADEHKVWVETIATATNERKEAP